MIAIINPVNPFQTITGIETQLNRPRGFVEGVMWRAGSDFIRYNFDVNLSVYQQNRRNAEWSFTEENPLMGAYFQTDEDDYDHFIQLGWVTLNTTCQAEYEQAEEQDEDEGEIHEPGAFMILSAKSRVNEQSNVGYYHGAAAGIMFLFAYSAYRIYKKKEALIQQVYDYFAAKDQVSTF